MKCVGFSPEFSQLEGVVWIKQSGGYDGGICASGSQEYVSFYLSYDNGATWLLQGTVNFTVYDIAGPHPLEYAVRVPIQPQKKFCFVANLPLVRAILSWNTPPTGPNATPVWGNVIQTRIQIPGFLSRFRCRFCWMRPRSSFPRRSLRSSARMRPSSCSSQRPSARLNCMMCTSRPRSRRIVSCRITSNPHSRIPASLASANKYLSSLKVDISAVIAALAATNGNTDFEQLECIELEEGDGGPDALIGTLQIKLPSGYLGGPCFAGSREYVAFWIDWAPVTLIRRHSIDEGSRYRCDSQGGPEFRRLSAGQSQRPSQALRGRTGYGESSRHPVVGSPPPPPIRVSCRLGEIDWRRPFS